MNIPVKRPCSLTFAPARLAALLITAVLFAGSPLQAGMATPIISPQAKVQGKTWSEWSAAWWQWAGAIPAGSNPVADQTGDYAALGQSGPVWFLAGNFGGVTERSITVPLGKFLFIPLLNRGYLGFPCDERGLPGCEVDEGLEAANDVATMLSFITPSLDGATLACEVDGVPIANLFAGRVESSAHYSLSLVEDNIFGLPGGAYHPCVDAGYYVMLPPLSVGPHTIHFGASTADGSFSLDVTYKITVR